MKLSRVIWFLFFLLGLSACAVAAGGDPGDDIDPEFTRADQQAWDSQHHNPTHATHSYLTEYAVDHVGHAYPEVLAYEDEILRGANSEVHELPTGDADLEAIRAEVEGTNAACKHPERLWAWADEDYRDGLRARAFFLLGILLHYVEDLGVPAHAFGVEHQGTWAEMDHFEWMATMKWAPDYTTVNRWNPNLASPDGYTGVSADWARSDFQAAFPGEQYTRTFFPMTWLFAKKKYTTFVKRRQARTAVVARWALESAMRAWSAH